MYSWNFVSSICYCSSECKFWHKPIMSEGTFIVPRFWTLYMHCNVSAMHGNITGNSFPKGFSAVIISAWLFLRDILLLRTWKYYIRPNDVSIGGTWHYMFFAQKLLTKSALGRKFVATLKNLFIWPKIWSFLQL